MANNLPHIDHLLIIGNLSSAPDASQAALLNQASRLYASQPCRITLACFITSKADASTAKSNAEKQIDSYLSANSSRSPLVRENIELAMVDNDDIAQWTINFVTQHNVGLVLKTGHRSEHFMYQPTDWALIRRLEVPLMLLAEEKWRNKNTLLATIDTENQSATQQQVNHSVLAWSTLFASVNQGDIHIASCIAINQPLEDLDIVHADSALKKKGPIVQKKLDEILESCQVTIQAPQIRAGQPARLIPSIANEIKADLVIMGSVGRSGIKGSLLGNTAEKVLKHLRTDVLIVKPADL